MSDYPLTHALVAELLVLDGTDAQLPLEILLNLHRVQLRAPFAGLVALTERLLPSAGDQLAPLRAEIQRRYPALNVETFANDEELSILDGAARVEMVRSWPEYAELTRDSANAPALLFAGYDASFEPYEPVLILLQLSWAISPEMRANRLLSLELELAKEPSAAALILDMAAEAVARPVQSE